LNGALSYIFTRICPALAFIARAQARASRIEDAIQTARLVAEPRERTRHSS
jgi:hypothetical protein